MRYRADEMNTAHIQMLSNLFQENRFPTIPLGRWRTVADTIATNQHHPNLWPQFLKQRKGTHKGVIATIRLQLPDNESHDFIASPQRQSGSLQLNPGPCIRAKASGVDTFVNYTNLFLRPSR